MKGKLETTVKPYLDLYTETVTREKEADEREKTAQAAWNRLFGTTGCKCLDIAARVEIRRENKNLLDEINAARAEKNILSRMLKVIQVSAERAAAESVLAEMDANPEKWSKYPVHYKKFAALVSDTFGEDVYIYNTFRGVQLTISDFRLTTQTIFYGGDDKLTPEIIADARKGLPGFYKPEEIENATRAAAAERAEYMRRYEEVKKELDATREHYLSGLQDIFPPVKALEILTYGL